LNLFDLGRLIDNPDSTFEIEPSSEISKMRNSAITNPFDENYLKESTNSVPDKSNFQNSPNPKVPTLPKIQRKLPPPLPSISKKKSSNSLIDGEIVGTENQWHVIEPEKRR
jgi:hypothetical protein